VNLFCNVYAIWQIGIFIFLIANSGSLMIIFIHHNIVVAKLKIKIKTTGKNRHAATTVHIVTILQSKLPDMQYLSRNFSLFFYQDYQTPLGKLNASISYSIFCQNK